MKTSTLNQLLLLVIAGTTAILPYVLISGSAHLYSGRGGPTGGEFPPKNPLQKLSCSTDTQEDDVLPVFEKLGRCVRLQNVCWHLGTFIVEKERVAELRQLLKHHSGWHPYVYPLKKSRLDSVIYGYPEHQQRIPAIPVRSRTVGAEPTTALNNPEYNKCVTPVVVYPYYLFNVGHSFQKVGSWLHAAKAAAHRSNLVRQMQIVVPTPEGLRLPSFQHQLLQPLSVWPVKSLVDASGMDPSLLGNGDELQPACYKQMLVCTGATARNLSQYGQYLAKHYTSLSGNSLKHQQPTQTVWRITFDARGGVGRQLGNLDELIKACSRTNIGTRRLQCNAVNFTDIVQGTQLMLNTDVVVGLHGAGLINAFLIPHQASVVEIIPLGLKRYVPYAERNVNDPQTSLSWYHLFNCDTSLSVPSVYELNEQKPEWSWPLYRGAKIEWESILTVLKNVAADSAKKGKYNEAYKSNKHSFYLQDGKVRQGTETDLRNSCPVTTDVAALNGRGGFKVKTKKINGLSVSWQIPPFARGIVLILNSETQKSTFCLSCPKSIQHQTLIHTAITGDSAVIQVTLPPNLRWDTAADPYQTTTGVRLRSILFTIIEEESLESLPVYAVGSGAEAANSVLMLPAILPPSLLRGLFVSQSTVPSEWLIKWLDMVEWYPAVAIVLPARNDDTKALIALNNNSNSTRVLNGAETDASEVMDSVQNYQVLYNSGVPTIKLTPNEAELNFGKIFGWLADSTVDFVL